MSKDLIVYEDKEHQVKSDIAELWAVDLESGEHKQAKAILCDLEDMSYCCMGRLCELAHTAGVCNKVIINGYVTYDDETQIPPPSVLEWAGIKNQAQDAEFDYGHLISYNDDREWTFPQIAAEIRLKKDVL